MGRITFLTTDSARGAVRVVGPVTGIQYVITSQGDPVSPLDASQLLDMVADPCCGNVLPLGGKVKLFGRTVGTKELLAKVTAEIRNAEVVPVKEDTTVDIPIPEKPTRKRRRSPKVVEVGPVEEGGVEVSVSVSEEVGWVASEE